MRTAEGSLISQLSMRPGIAVIRRWGRSVLWSNFYQGLMSNYASGHYTSKSHATTHVPSGSHHQSVRPGLDIEGKLQHRLGQGWSTRGSECLPHVKNVISEPGPPRQYEILGCGTNLSLSSYVQTGSL